MKSNALTPEAFRDALLMQRARAGLTQAQAAQRMAIARQRWQEWETGAVCPPLYARPLILGVVARWPAASGAPSGR